MKTATLRKHSGDLAQCRDCQFYHAFEYVNGEAGKCKCPKCVEAAQKWQLGADWARSVRQSWICKCDHFKICEGQRT